MDISLEEFAAIASMVFSGIAILASIRSARISAWGNIKASQASRSVDIFLMNEKRRVEKEDRIRTYKEPLIRAAADLQSRIYNIVKGDFFQTYYVEGGSRQRDYAINNTVFLFAQFFAWTEAARCEIQFISLDDDNQTRELCKLQNEIYHYMGTEKLGEVLMVFAGEQRAIGEGMLVPYANGVKCIGYGKYVKDYIQPRDASLNYLTEEIERIAAGNTNDGHVRLTKMQHALIDLMDFLDPDSIRFPKEDREKL
ncbi:MULTISPECIES: lysogenic protein [unclassified Serratia (in: enterobacteria)]|uniref:lysogenic protein n=1 Tax=unclassified Serratia (in: enterobacteria) TaxID=2647522 RepID=UPI00307613BF